MKLLIVRHAAAEERRAWAKVSDDDGLRPLTKDGRHKFARAAKGLRRLVHKLDLIVTSPLTRAIETAELLADEFGETQIVRRAELSASKRPQSIIKWLASHAPGATIALVGHDPSLPILASWLLTGLHEPVIDLGKGGACLIEFSDLPGPGGGRLKWLATPRQLLRIRR